jgi:16S rRNA processing protein RimM
VTFEGVGSTEEAERLRGTTLTAAPLEVDGALWVDELMGARVVATDGTALGEIVAVEANPASDLLVLDSGALIPSRFVVGGIEGGTVTVDVPDGLV